MIADIVALDRDDRPLLVAEIKASALRPGLDAADQLLKMMAALDAPFGLLVDLEEMVFIRRDVEGPNSVVLELKTTDVLLHYDPEFAGKDSHYGSRRIFREYLETLVEGWLRDLAYRWKSPEPPGSGALAKIGLLERLSEGTTRSEVRIGGAALR